MSGAGAGPQGLPRLDAAAGWHYDGEARGGRGEARMRRGVWVGIFVLGCGGGGGGSEGATLASSGGIVTLSASSGGESEGTSPTEPTGGSGMNGSGGLPKFDVGIGETTSGPPPATGCKRVDVVIAIDNSSSMQEEIAALAGPVFDSFPAALLDVGNGLDDFQLAVIDACNSPPFLHDTGAGGACGFSTGTNFMSSTSPALYDEYHCVTELTTSGYMGLADDCSGDNDDEQPANTAADAVSPPAAGAENAGFVRDDAVLFVVAITDEDEQPVPSQSAQEIVDKYVAAKGLIDNVVFLGIGGDTACDGPYGGAEEAVLLREVASIFAASQRGIFWDLCQGDLEQAFQTALGVVDSACIEFMPPN